MSTMSTAACTLEAEFHRTRSARRRRFQTSARSSFQRQATLAGHCSRGPWACTCCCCNVLRGCLGQWSPCGLLSATNRLNTIAGLLNALLRGLLFQCELEPRST
jgi:hypothetical protein